MPLLAHTFLAVALLIQAALGPSGITLDVCHGRLQWAAADGESCCGEDGCLKKAPEEPACGCAHDPKEEPSHDEPEGGPSLEVQNDCTTCFTVALEGVDEACEAPSDSVLVIPAGESMCVVLSGSVPEIALGHRRGSRAPPDRVLPPGLLPGTFPLRI